MAHEYDSEIPVPSPTLGPGGSHWRPPARMPDGRSPLERLLELVGYGKGGATDPRNMAMALPFGRQASAAGAAAPRMLGLGGRVKQGGSAVEQVIKDWKQANKGQGPQSNEDWERVAQQARERAMARRVDSSNIPSLKRLLENSVRQQIDPRSGSSRNISPKALAMQGSNLDHIMPGFQEPEGVVRSRADPQREWSSGGLGALFPALMQPAQTGGFDAPARGATSGFDRFLSAQPEMAEYFLDL